jgi:hypothetical protein
MPKFDAGTVVESLEWDFSTTKITALKHARGVIPEPSDAAIGRFLDGLKKLYSEAQGMAGGQLGPDATPDEMLEAISSLTGDAFVSFMSDTAGLFAELCDGKPSKEQLLALPLRVRAHFYGWVQSEVINPEVGPGAGTAAVTQLRSAAAG